MVVFLLIPDISGSENYRFHSINTFTDLLESNRGKITVEKLKSITGNIYLY